MYALSLLCMSCERKENAPEPTTPDEMYAHVQSLLKPNVEGAESDFAGAMQWLHKAAEGGHLQAQTDLGGIYLQGGKGVSVDPLAAYHWFSRAAAQGSKEAMVYVGNMLYSGQGCKQDIPKAIDYLRRAAEAGLPDAQYRLGLILLKQGGSDVQAVELLRRAATGEHLHTAAMAAGLLGNIYARGHAGVAQDMQQAATWYKQAARGGDARSQLVYALMLLDGEIVPKDEQQGMALLRMAAGQDYPQAIAVLINLLRNASNAADNEPEAAAWAERLEALRQKPAS